MLLWCYRIVRRLPPRKRARWLRRLERWGADKRLTRLGARCYVQDGRHITVDLGDHVGREMFKNGWYERIYIDFIGECLANSSRVFMDVGANVGNYSLALASIFDHVMAFEPNPETFAALKKNCENNGQLPIRLFNVGLSDHDDTLSFVSDTSGNTGQSGFRDPSSNEVSIQLPVRRGDDYTSNNMSIGLIKIDVEGHELHVLRGLQQTIARDHPVIALEWHTAAMGGAEGFAQLTQLLPRNYQFWFSTSRSGVKLAEVALPLRDKYNLIFCSPTPLA